MANSESSQQPDLQDLVAYLQGRGDEALRAQVLKRLDEDESYLELMVDLVPMLRAAGEIADPDAEEEDGGEVAGLSPPAPAAAPLPFVSPPPSVTPLPLPANSPATATRFRRWPAVAALAALVPIAVSVWLMSQKPRPPLVYQLAQTMAPGVDVKQLAADNPWESRLRGSNDRGSGESHPSENDTFDPANFLMASGQIFALEVAVKKRDLEAANERVDFLKKWLPDDFAATYADVQVALKKEPLVWESVDRLMDESYAFFPEVYKPSHPAWSLLEEGACWRAAWLAAIESDALPEVCTKLLPHEASGADTKKLKLLLDDRLEKLAPEDSLPPKQDGPA